VISLWISLPSMRTDRRYRRYVRLPLRARSCVSAYVLTAFPPQCCGCDSPTGPTRSRGWLRMAVLCRWWPRMVSSARPGRCRRRPSSMSAEFTPRTGVASVYLPARSPARPASSVTVRSCWRPGGAWRLRLRGPPRSRHSRPRAWNHSRPRCATRIAVS